MSYEGVLAVVAIGINFSLSAAYVVSVFQKKVQPHVLSWLLWGILQAIVAVVQYYSQAGAAVWVTALAGANCFFIAALALFYYGERNITLSDKAFFGLALSIVPFWVLTKSPVPAAVLVAVIDALGYGPTFRKSYASPHQENVYIWGANCLSNVLTLFAIEQFSFSASFPIAVSAALNGALAGFLVFRRLRLKTQIPSA